MSLREKKREKYKKQVHNPAWDINDMKRTYYLRMYDIHHVKKKKKRKKKRL